MITRLVKFLLFLYRKVRIAPSPCRYYPSCSYYAEEAIEKHGPIKGLFLALRRLISCNQLSVGGYDPVPKK